MPAINLRASDFKLTAASIAMIAGGAITVVGYLLPWASMTGSVLGQSLGTTVAGSDFLIVIIGLALVVGGLAFAYRTQQFRIAWVAVGIVSIVGLVIMLRYFGDINNASSQLGSLGGLAGISINLGLGFFATVIGLIVALVGAALGRKETLVAPAP
jgi:hypothetical protein